jgi:hypothetical protein
LHANAGRRDEDAVALAALDHLGICRDDRYARLPRGLRQRGDDAFQIGEGKAFFEDESGRKTRAAWHPSSRRR